MFPLLSKLPTLRSRRNPTAAAVIGCLFGALGLAIYFRSLLDFFAAMAGYVAIAVVHGAPVTGWVVGAALAGAYGLCRAIDSNDRLTATDAAIRVGR